jgi:hypothetical protein
MSYKTTLARLWLLVLAMLLCTQALFAGDHAPAAGTADDQWDDRFGPPGVDGGGWHTNLFLNPPSEFDETRVLALATSGDDLYVGGRFSSAGGSPANFIACWNRTTDEWSALDTGLNESANAIAVDGEYVYVGGNFTQAGGVSALHVARWNRTTGEWSALGAGLGDAAIIGNRVNALAVVAGSLYAGGIFTKTGAAPLNHIARWDGAAWQPVGAGVDQAVEALLAVGSTLYVGGEFTTAGGTGATLPSAATASGWVATSPARVANRRLISLVMVCQASHSLQKTRRFFCPWCNGNVRLLVTTNTARRKDRPFVPPFLSAH